MREAEDSVKSLEQNYQQSESEADLIALNEEQAKLLRAMSEEEAFWKQKACLLWM